MHLSHAPTLLAGPSGVSSASAQLQSCINRRLSLGTQGAAAAALLSGQPPAAQMQPATQAMHSAELAQHAGGVPRVAPATWLSAFTPLDLGPSELFTLGMLRMFESVWVLRMGMGMGMG